MVNLELYKSLKKIVKTKVNQSLKNYCSIKIGGVARFVCFPRSVKQFKKLMQFLRAKKIRYYILGNGTNVFFDDAGFNGVVVCLKQINKIRHNKNKLVAGAGANLFLINYYCKVNNLVGFCWSYGIPASIGGAVVMNAGAYGFEMKDVVDYVLVYHNGKIKRLNNKDLKFEYRSSVIKNSNMIVLKVCLKLKFGSKDLIALQQNEYMQSRLNSQPYKTFNCGSVFKKVNGQSAGKVIDKMGLKGVKIGDIKISEKHANFFINLGGASSKDMLNAISFVKSKAFLEFKLILKEEVIFVGS